ncbi:hypothetical protein PIB30_053528 [Stylosanthes scabra]|uniref:Uncharacterized protein n=1 Tax=Stylosanthes scabra TaxID=79078 RepID=A0ABU6VI29_9FABA|nr:hypothetical protein [Stylosanthes scabra]
MTKTNVLYVLIIMIIGTFICYAISEFEDAIIRDLEKPWFPIADDAHDLKKCYAKCEQTYDKFLSKRSTHRRERCRNLCKKLNKCIEGCNEHYGNEEESKKCIEEYCNQRNFYYNLGPNF